MDMDGKGMRRGRGHVLSGYNSYITSGWIGGREFLFQSFFLLPRRKRQEGRRKRVKLKLKKKRKR